MLREEEVTVVLYLVTRLPPGSELFPYTTLFRSINRLNGFNPVLGYSISGLPAGATGRPLILNPDRKSTRLNSSHITISYAVFCLKKKKTSHKINEGTSQ